MKVCFISPKTFPVPAIKGGAVETLLTEIINQNEKFGLLDLDVFTRYEKENEETLKSYKNTRMFAIDFEEFQNCGYDKDSIDKLEQEKFMNAICDYAKNEQYDYMIIEGGDVHGYEQLYKIVDKNKLIIHLHSAYTPTHYIEEHYSKFITISEYAVDFLCQGNIIPRDRVRLLYNGVKIEDFNKMVSDEEIKSLKEKYGINDNEKVVTFIGRTIEEKGVRELILAFKKMQKDCNAKLIIVGNSNFGNMVVNDYDRELVRISEEIKDRIVFTGFIHNKELYKIYNITDLAAFPHLCEEGFGLVFVEAMATGTPLIASNSGAAAEVIGDAGIIVEKNDREKMIDELAENMKMLLENDEMRNKMAERGKARACEFSIEKHYMDFVKLIKELN